MKYLMKRIVPMFALAIVMAGVPAFAAATLCIDEDPDGMSLVVLPDCSTVQLTTCYCDADDADTQSVTITDLEDVLDVSGGGIFDCNGVELVPVDCDDSVESDSVFIDDVVRRTGQGTKNATPNKNKPKGTADITCDTCDSGDADANGESVDVTWDLANGKKNNHYDVVLSDEGGEICRVGLNVHTQSCDP